MSDKDQGGYAFPATSHVYKGMTMRDYFAAAALTGICASCPSAEYTDARLAQEAYNLADAMIKARGAE